MVIDLFPDLPFSPNRQGKLGREGINDGNPYPMQAAGDLVVTVVKLTTRMKDRHDDLCGRPTLFLVHIRRNTPAIV